MSDTAKTFDFFISYNAADRAWAEWIAWQLEASGYSASLQAWDILTGNNFPLEMQRMLNEARHVIPVLSPDYLQATFPRTEWAAAFAKDPTGEKRLLLPVRVREVELSGLFQSITYTDLVGLAEVDARRRLLDIVNTRLKPTEPPPYPGTARSDLRPPPFPLTLEPRTGTVRPHPGESSAERRTELLKHHVRASVAPLRRASPRLPAELIKESDSDPSDLLRLFADLARLPTVPQQLEVARARRFAELYARSRAELESQLFSLSILRIVVDGHVALPTNGALRVYDAGCATGGLRTVLSCLEDTRQQCEFQYVGQDNNPDWKPLFEVEPGVFLQATLPEVRTDHGLFDLVTCVNTLHLFGANPLLIASAVQGFNMILLPRGLCVLIVPEKEAQPGMLDLLEEIAQRAYFEVLTASRYRIKHRLNDDDARNVATFLVVVGRKRADVEKRTARSLFVASRHRAGLSTDSEGLEELTSEIAALESGLLDLMSEEHPNIRFLRSALVDAADRSRRGSLPSRSNATQEVRRANLALSELLLVGTPGSEVADAVAEYFHALITWTVSAHPDTNVEALIAQVIPKVRLILQQTNPDARIRMANLNTEQVAKLLRNLFEVCTHEGIDLRAAVGQESSPWV